MLNVESKNKTNNKISKIILIQKNLRGFLSRKIFEDNIKNAITNNIINKILLIQKYVKEFLCKKKVWMNFW